MFDIVMKKVFLAKMNQYSITIRRLFVVVVVVQITSKTIFTNRLHYFEKKNCNKDSFMARKSFTVTSKLNSFNIKKNSFAKLFQLPVITRFFTRTTTLWL